MEFLKFEEVDKRYQRTNAFFRFLYYDWGDDEDEGGEDTADSKKQPEKTNGNNKGTKEWQIYKEVNQFETKDKFGKQALKRDFYNKHVDRSFNESVNVGLDDEAMNNFNKYCHYYNCLGIVGYDALFRQQGQLLFERRLLHLLYFVTYPLNMPYCWSLILLACFLSIIMPNPRQKNQNVILNLFEEESINIALIVFLAPSGPIMKTLLNGCLMMWSVQHVSLLAYQQLESNPETTGLTILTPLINYLFYHKVELNFVKNVLEVVILFMSVPFVFLNQTALIFPIFYYQFIKVKYMSNAYQKHIWKHIWQFCEKYAPPIIGLCLLCGFGKDSPPANKKPDAQTIIDEINAQEKNLTSQQKKKAN